MKLVDFIIPETLEDACESLRDLGDNGIAAAGCTAFHFYTQDVNKTAVLLTKTGINKITAKENLFHIGAMTPLSDILHFQETGWVLNRVAGNIASHQIRNVSTLGGNIAHVFPWADLPVALLALGGSVCISDGSSERHLDIDDYFSSRPDKHFSAGELLKNISVPACSTQQGFGYVKQRMKSEAFSLCTTAAGITIGNNSISQARVALGAAIGFPSRLQKIESALNNQPAKAIEQSLIADNLDDVRFMKKEGMSPEYIKELAVNSITDAVNQALTEARGGES